MCCVFTACHQGMCRVPRSGQSQASAWDVPLLFQDPNPAGRAMLQCRTCWEDTDTVQAKGFRLMISKELGQRGKDCSYYL